MAHAHAGAEVGVGDAFGGAGFQQGADHRVGTRVPAGGDDRNRAGDLGGLVQRAVQLPDLGVDVKAVHGVDAFGKIELGVFLYRAGRQAQQGNLRLDRQLVDVVDNGDAGKLLRLLRAGIVANHADQLHILSGLDGLKGVMSDISISDNDYFGFFHTIQSLLLFYYNRLRRTFFNSTMPRAPRQAMAGCRKGKFLSKRETFR